MRIMKRILCALALTGMLLAQDTTTTTQTSNPQHSNPSRVFVLKYADADTVARVLAVFGNVNVRSDRGMHVVAVNAPAEIMPSVEEAINRLDVPAAAPRDIDLVVYMVVASQQASAPDNLLPELQPVAAELKRVFAYKSFHLLDSVAIRIEPGRRASARGVIREAGEGKSPYTLDVNSAAVTDDPKGRLIRLSDLSLTMRVPGGDEAGVHTDITVREGQRVVVGKSNIGPDQALILVLSAKVVD